MPDIQLGAHTIRSHGTHVAKLHMHDWLILMLLVVIEVGLNVIEPFHRFVGEGMMENLKYPLQENTIPLWAVPVTLVLTIRIFWWQHFQILIQWIIWLILLSICFLTDHCNIIASSCHYHILLHQEGCLWLASSSVRYYLVFFFIFFCHAILYIFLQFIPINNSICGTLEIAFVSFL